MRWGWCPTWTQPPVDHVFVKTTRSKAAAAARIEAARTARTAGELLERLRSCFVRTQTWQHAGRYVSALVSDIPKRNGWTIAQQTGDRTPDRTQRLNRAVWFVSCAPLQATGRSHNIWSSAAARGRSRRRASTRGAAERPRPTCWRSGQRGIVVDVNATSRKRRPVAARRRRENGLTIPSHRSRLLVMI
jgi:hypothetical protein